MRVLLVVSLLMILVLLSGCAATPPAAQTSPAVGSSLTETQVHSATLWVKGLACPFCVHNIDKKLLEVPGVRAVDVELETGKVVVTLSPTAPPSEQVLRDAITNSGFSVDTVEMP